MLRDRLREIRKAKHMTLEEVAAKVGTSKQTVARYESGEIEHVSAARVEALARALGVTPSALMGWDGEQLSRFENMEVLENRHLPMLGRIACGKPMYAEEDGESFAAVSDRLGADFCLKTRGDSMIGARIYDGDTVFIRAQDAVDNGEIAAVIIGEEATLKRVYYYPEKQKLVLSPENPKYEPLVYVGEELNHIKIIGKAVAFQSVIV